MVKFVIGLVMIALTIVLTVPVMKEMGGAIGGQKERPSAPSLKKTVVESMDDWLN
ncbi:hypothetical protein [Brevibacillus dissolubilis]|uniref:hypothetical protein n=1 Tax=Brevibacillus dissolubilis TaxID=1844116 RepID=UPI00159B9621|nr:hypothetical protein [Brevibacillus dissolubilis]